MIWIGSPRRGPARFDVQIDAGNAANGVDHVAVAGLAYSTVTDLARLRG